MLAINLQKISSKLIILIVVSIQMGLGIYCLQGKPVGPSSGFEKLLEMAEEGNATAQHQVGTNYLAGVPGGSKDYVKAAYWFSRAAQQELPIAQFKLGLCFENALGLEKDVDHALTLYKMAADKGVEVAQVQAALILKQKNLWEEAAKYFKMATDHENVVAQREYGHLLLLGKCIPQKDELDSISYLEKAARSGDPKAHLYLAEGYSGTIEGVKPNLHKMVEHLWEAASSGLPEAQSKIGFCYEEGLGLPKDVELAVKWYTKAADLNHPQALVNLGHCYANGRGVVGDHGKAVKFYRMAADQEFPTALYNLGVCYMTGVGVEKDPGRGMEYLLQAAELNDSNSQNYLGILYEHGRNGIERDNKTAFYWYQKLADQLDLRGLKALAHCYMNGIGIQIDENEAYKYYKIAKDLEN